MTTTPMTDLAGRLAAKAADAENGVTRAREAIAARAADYGPTELADLVHAFAVHLARYRVFADGARIANAGDDGLMLDGWLLASALASPDDTWSGRGNDLKRVEADARREALREVDQLIHIVLLDRVGR